VDANKLTWLLATVCLMFYGILYFSAVSSTYPFVYVIIFLVFIFINILVCKLNLDLTNGFGVIKYLRQRYYFIIPVLLFVIIDVCMTLYYIYFTNQFVEGDSRMGFLLSLPFGHVIFTIVMFSANILFPIGISLLIFNDNLKNPDGPKIDLKVEKVIWSHFLAVTSTIFLNNIIHVLNL